MDSTYLGDPSSLGPIIAMFAAFIFLFVIIGIVFYIFFSIGLYKLAKNNGDDIAWMAFIPVAQYYTMGNLVKGNFTIFGKRIEKIEVILPIAMFIGGTLSAIPVIGFLVAIALLILYISVVYHVFKKYKGQQATMFTILSIVFAFLYPFFIFAMRNSAPVDLSYGTAGNAQNAYANNYSNNNYSNNNNFNTYDSSTFGTSTENNGNATYNVSENNSNSNLDNNDGGNNQG